jgi:predicted small integral membrane protein
MSVELWLPGGTAGLFLITQALGLSVWLTLAVVNNLQAFRSSVGAVGATMAMAPLHQAPAIDIPLLRRAVRSHHLHQLALVIVLALQVIAAVAAWTGSYQLVLGDGLSAARPWLNLALSGFSAFVFAMLLGGLWFGYWIRQEGLQLTHLVLAIWALSAFALFNLQWA